MAGRRHSSAQHSDDNYSEDFISDEEEPRRSQPTKLTRSSPARGRGHGRGKGRGGGRGQGTGRHSQARSDSGMDVVTRRLLSASRLKIGELQNQSEDLKRQLRIVMDENKLYKRMQHKQEKALEKFEDQESDLPQLLQAHNNEVRTLREQLRRTREKYEKTDRYLRDAEDDLERVNAKLKKYKEMAEKKDLAERIDLDRRLNKAELTIEESDSRIKELERHLKVLKKNHRHELGIEHAHSKEVQRQLEEVQEAKEKLETQLREKEKMLEMKNIYSNRFLKPPSYNGTPSDSPPHWRQNLKKKSPSLTELNNPREKARIYEEKRREEQKKKQDPKMEPSQDNKQKWEEEYREKDADHGPKFNFISTRQDSESDFWRRMEEETKKKRDEANREKQRQEDEERHQREDDEREQERFHRERDKIKRDMEERERAERERRGADERERREREGREKKERERRERDRKEAEASENEQKAREKEEQERKAKEEQERRARKEQERLDNDPRFAEERQKKDELLHRLQQLDAVRNGSQPNDPFAPILSKPAGRPNQAGGDMDDPFAVPTSTSPGKRGNKEPFLLGRADSSDSTPSNKKDYTFTRSVENLHHGKPAHDDVYVPYIDRQRKVKAAKEDAEIGGYQPSFAGSAKSAQQKKPLSLFDDDKKPSANSSSKADKKSKLMEDLFGPQASKSSAKPRDEPDDIFLTNKKTPKEQSQLKRTSGSLWDDNPSAKTNGSAHREGSTLFGGGAALVDEDNDTGGSSSVLLPRRPRQTSSTFSSKPAVTAVDNLDDSLEEVIL